MKIIFNLTPEEIEGEGLEASLYKRINEMIKDGTKIPDCALIASAPNLETLKFDFTIFWNEVDGWPVEPVLPPGTRALKVVDFIEPPEKH